MEIFRPSNFSQILFLKLCFDRAVEFSVVGMHFRFTSVARAVFDHYQDNGLTFNRARLTVQLVDASVCGASLNGSCAIEVTGE